MKNAKTHEAYSEEELREMVEWFNTRELPKTLQINKSSFSPDLPLTVESLIMQAEQNLGNYKMAGSFRLLKEIRNHSAYQKQTVRFLISTNRLLQRIRPLHSCNTHNPKSLLCPPSPDPQNRTYEHL